VRIRIRAEADRALFAPKQVIGHAEHVKAVHSVKVDQLGNGELAVAPRRMGMQLAEQHPRLHAWSVAAAPPLWGEKAV
jgi:hypothetical protein